MSFPCFPSPPPPERGLPRGASRGARPGPNPSLGWAVCVPGRVLIFKAPQVLARRVREKRGWEEDEEAPGAFGLL